MMHDRTMLSTGEGQIEVDAGDSGVTIVAGNVTETVTIVGTIAQINHLLLGSGTGTVEYFNPYDAPSSSTYFAVTVNDQGNSGLDPGLTGDSNSEEGTNSVSIHLTAINDDPRNAGSLPNEVIVVEDVTTTGGTLSNNPLLQNDIAQVEEDFRDTDEIKYLRFYPVVSLGVNYRF